VRSTLRLSATRFLRTPRWTIPILLTLVVAIGATAAIFAVMEAVFLRSYPYSDPGRLVVLHDEYRGPGKTGLGLSEPELLDYAAASREIERLGAYNTGRFTVNGGAPRQVDAAWVSEGFLRVLRAGPAVGRGFTPEEERPGGTPVALVSHRFWKEELSGRDLRGLAPLRTEQEPVQVVGVLPADFRLPSDLSGSSHADVIFPLRLNPAEPGHRQNPYLQVVGRLAPHATLESARAEQARLAASFRTAHPQDYPEQMGFAMAVVPLAEEVVGSVRVPLMVVCGAVALLFLVALSNASGLILARLDGRRQELGVRVAVGARFAQLFREFMQESLVLALAASIPGILLAYALGRFLLALHADTIPRLSGLSMGRWVLLFVSAAGLAIVVVFALASTLRIARSNWARRVMAREAPAGAAGFRPGSGRRFLAGGQITFTVVLLVGAVFLISSYRNVMAVELGFNPRNVLVFDTSLPVAGYGEPAQVNAGFGSLLARVRSVPGVRSAALVAFLPLENAGEVWPVEVKDRVAEHRATGVSAQVVSDGYFGTLGIRVRQGRDFQASDEAAAQPVVVVDEAFAREFFPGQSPLGRLVRPRLSESAPWATVVGVVADVRHAPVTEAPVPHIYFLYHHIPRFAGVAIRSMRMTAATPSDPDDWVAAVRGAVRAHDPELALGAVRTLDEVVAHATSRLRFPMQLLGIFGAMALVVSLSGIYAVISQLVAGSTRDVGIRMAMGASPGRILRFMLGQGLVLAVSSVVLGLVLAVAVMRLSAHLFYGVTPGAVSLYAAVGVTMSAAAAAACFFPARQAANLEPNQALREGV
jgi:predicted permease